MNETKTPGAGRDYRPTVFLPKTEFPMKAGLPKREPELLEHWRRLDLWRRLRAEAKGREKFILHDGPPYANAHLHIGHALNKILKDVVTRSQQMLGKDSNYVPGWDCHGLPIEWKIEEEYRAKGKDKDAVPIVEFRKQCRDFAAHWMGVQSEEFQRLGCAGDWDHPYSTMSNDAEALIAAEIHKFLMNGGLYRGDRPVLWSVVERTALADAEVEYHEHVSTTVYVRFPVVRAPTNDLKGASVAIWTTTPWTLPGNRAIAFSKDIYYTAVRVEDVAEDSLVKKGERLIVATDLLPATMQAAKVTRWTNIGPGNPEIFSKIVCAHPLRGKGYEFDVRLFSGDFVTADTGTGFVHIAPGHGADDFTLGTAHGIEVPQTVGPDGAFFAHVKLFAGKRVLTEDGKHGDANEAVIAELAKAGALLARGKLKHDYPHSWRSKAPLIFRNTPQWFIGMERNDLRLKALAAIEATSFYPPAGKTRLYSMIEQRPDWCISRQRAWGVPIALFVDKKSGEPLQDPEVNQRIVEAFREAGADAWFTREAQEFLGNKYKAADYEQIRDIVEVWFESGSTHAFVLEPRKDKDLAWPASLYLEGSDQHRGWFHSSLLESCGTRGRAPYEGVLTHGFVLDEQGRKMSKSLGNVTAPQDVVGQHGADILRLWVVASDFSADLGIGPEIVKAQVDAYRRLRNTLRYLLGAVAGFEEREKVPARDMPELERFVLHRLAELDALVRERCAVYDFHAVFTHLHQFCAADLSAFYFDVRKDTLYCDRPDAKRRRACRTVLDQLFSCLTAWLAPILCFTAEEAWLVRRAQAGGKGEESVHLRLFPPVPAEWRDDKLAARWDRLRAARRVVTGALEIERAAKRIGSSLQAAPVLYAEEAWRAELGGADMDEICITSGLVVAPWQEPPQQGAFALPDVAGLAVRFEAARGAKCARCWQVLPEVGTVAGHAGLCRRCADAVTAFDGRAG